MISIAPVFLLAPFGIYLLVHFSLALLNIRHIFKTGSISLTSFFLTFVFLFYSFAVIGITWGMVGNYTWDQPISLEIGGIVNSVEALNNGQ